MLNEAAARLSKLEATLAQNDGFLNKAWSGLPLESKSKQTIETRISQAKGMAGRLSGQTHNMGVYLDQVGMRFLEADRHCSEGYLKELASTAAVIAGGGASSPFFAEREKYEPIYEEYNSLNIYEEEMSDPPIVSWLKGYGSKYILPFSGIVGTTIRVSEDIHYNDADAFSVAGTATVGIGFHVLDKTIKAGSALFIGKVIVGTAVAATAPMWAIGAVAVGAGIAVGYGVSVLLDLTIKDKIYDHGGDIMSDIYRSAGEMANSVGSSAVQAGATAVDAISSGLESVAESVGSAVESTGEMFRGVGEKLRFWE